MRKLGRIQLEVLESLRRHGKWTNRGIASGWVWDTPLNTERILDLLVKRNLVSKDTDGVYRLK